MRGEFCFSVCRVGSALMLPAAFVAATLSSGCDPVPAACGFGDCASGEVRVVGQDGTEMCVGTLPPGADCSPTDPTSVCAEGTACRLGPDLEFQCLPGPGLLEACSARSAEIGAFCEYNFSRPGHTYCKPARCFPFGSIFAQRAPQGTCSNFAAFQGTCDGDFPDIANATGPGDIPCSPCEPGLTCVDGFCMERCEEPEDCPCADDGETPQTSCVMDEDTGERFCAERCVSPGASCDGSVLCCDEGAMCQAQADGESRCILGPGAPCEEGEPCVDDLVCVFGSCETCRDDGELCEDDADCCGSQGCAPDGTCQQPCEPGGDCTATDAQGACREGTFVCPNPFGPRKCMPAEPTEETCNGIDDNCNGEVDDDIEAETCMTTPEECDDREGFEVEGQTQCVDGETVCEAVSLTEDPENGTYCNFASGGEPCGVEANNVCASEFGVLPCVPNHTCEGPFGDTNRCVDNPECGSTDEPDCWLPEETGTCVDTTP